jgi:hypothetical protein
MPVAKLHHSVTPLFVSASCPHNERRWRKGCWANHHLPQSRTFCKGNRTGVPTCPVVGGRHTAPVAHSDAGGVRQIDGRPQTPRFILQSLWEIRIAETSNGVVHVG